MNTFRAVLLPCAGTAGGVPAQPSAAGRPIAIRGDLSGREKARGLVSFSRPVRQRQPQPEFISTGHGARRAIFAANAFARVRGRLDIGLAARGCGAANSGQPVPINFLGLGRALQPSEQPRSGLAQTLHSRTPFQMHLHRMSNHAGKDGQGVEK